MRAINIILTGLAAMLLLTVLLTSLAWNGTHHEFAFKVLALWFINLFLQLAALVLIIISFTRVQPAWARVLHAVYLAGILAFYCVFAYAMLHVGDSVGSFSFGTH